MFLSEVPANLRLDAGQVEVNQTFNQRVGQAQESNLPNLQAFLIQCRG